MSSDFLETVCTDGEGSAAAGAPLSVRRWVEHFECSLYKTAEIDNLTARCSLPDTDVTRVVLFLRLDQAREFLRAAETLREKLIIRYFMLNGLSPMELSNGRIEHLDPVSSTLFLPRRHWKRNCLTDIDAETVKLQSVYSGDRTEGPLIRARHGGPLKRCRICEIIKTVASRTNIPGWERISPIVLKRTFAREWLLSGGNVGTLQKQFSHKHLWSTAHYLRFVMEDVKPDHKRMLKKVAQGGET